LDTRNELTAYQIKKSIKAEVISIAKKNISQSQGKCTRQNLKAYNLQALRKLIPKKTLDPTVYALSADKKVCKQQHSALHSFHIFRTAKSRT
jgi:citrate lyase synthetase